MSIFSQNELLKVSKNLKICLTSLLTTNKKLGGAMCLSSEKLLGLFFLSPLLQKFHEFLIFTTKVEKKI